MTPTPAAGPAAASKSTTAASAPAAPPAPAPSRPARRLSVTATVALHAVTTAVGIAACRSALTPGSKIPVAAAHAAVGLSTAAVLLLGRPPTYGKMSAAATPAPAAAAATPLPPPPPTGSWWRRLKAAAGAAAAAMPVCPPAAAWTMQEAPALITGLVALTALPPCPFFSGPGPSAPSGAPGPPVPPVDALLWLCRAAPPLLFAAHYLHRTAVYPARCIAADATPVPLHVTLCANVYCCFNGVLQGTSAMGAALGSAAVGGPVALGGDAPRRSVTAAPLAPLLCACGSVGVFAAGLAINIYHDRRLFLLRTGAATAGMPAAGAAGAAGPRGEPPVRVGRYVLPTGGLFRWLSTPNLSGEILEWAGFAGLAVSIVPLVAWAGAVAGGDGGGGLAAVHGVGLVAAATADAVGAVSFTVFVICNLAPRALQQHWWYHERFPGYAALRRRALVPFLL